MRTQALSGIFANCGVGSSAALRGKLLPESAYWALSVIRDFREIIITSRAFLLGDGNFVLVGDVYRSGSREGKFKKTDSI